jgi:hypothetical protein
MLQIYLGFDGVPVEYTLPIYENSLYFRYVMAILTNSGQPGL